MITNKTIEEIYNEYLESGISMDKLSEKYHADIPKHFKRAGYKTYTSSEAHQIFRINKFNLNWKFQSITNQYEAYIIGLLMADGYVGDSQIGLRLKESDKDLVEKVKNYFCEDIKLQHYKNTYSFVVSSKIACNNIQKLGMYKNKTNIELHIPQMDEALIRHFIRGYFDGDGTVFKYKNGNYIFLRCNICSPTINILQEMCYYLQKHNITCKINKENRIGKTCCVPSKNKVCISKCDMYRLFINSKDSIHKFYDLMYTDADIFLQRKFDVFNENRDCLTYIKHVNTEVKS